MTNSTTSRGTSTHQLKAGAMDTKSIVFIIVATAAPLTAMVAVLPVAIAFGNGIGVPGAYLVASLVLALFAIGYASMSRHLTNAGAFFAYITAGLGRRMGMAGGLVAIVVYNVFVLYVAGLVGYFGNQTFLAELGVNIPWEVFSFGLLAFALGAGILGIEFSARVLGVLLSLETALLLLLGLATLFTEGPGAYPISALSPHEIFSGEVGIAFVFVFVCFVGFEAAAIFGEEAIDPRRTVSRATLIGIAFIGAVYLFSSWSIIAASGGTAAPALALEEPGIFTIAASTSVLGEWSAHVMSWLLLTSLIAVLMALHNMATRYLMAFGREGVLPTSFGRTHGRFQTPHVAACVQAIFVAVVVAIYALLGADPYLDLGNQTAGLGMVGLMALMTFTAIAVIGFFWGRKERHWLTHMVAPGIAAICFAVVCYLIIDNYALLTGSTSAIVNGLPWLILIAAVIGFAIGSVRPLRTPLDVFGTADDEPGGVHPLPPEVERVPAATEGAAVAGAESSEVDG